MSTPLDENLESILATVARLFALEGAVREVELLFQSKAEMVETGYDNWNGGTYFYTLRLEVPIALFSQIEPVKNELEATIHKKASLYIGADQMIFQSVSIHPQLITSDEKWRDKARDWVMGKGVTNQGRVRSDNLASRQFDGLLFRSEPEIMFYKAMKASGIPFAPLPVFIRGGSQYQRVEPDFVIMSEGIVLVVEIDGDTFHKESPAEAHYRTQMFSLEGAHVERIKATDCDTDEKALECVRRVRRVLLKLKAARG
ncbi:hypothetical protein AAC03nite_26340 [Alicyclobacillus acidoterrestris]|nr:hypothetical protein AAC03nite_26340 [Alicyclobacillus acidoterrestris]